MEGEEDILENEEIGRREISRLIRCRGARDPDLEVALEGANIRRETMEINGADPRPRGQLGWGTISESRPVAK